MSYSPVCIVTGHTCVMWDFKLWFIEGLNRRIQKKNKTITNIQTGLDFWIILMIRHARITGVKQCIQYWTDSCRPLVTEASREARRRFVERWRGFLTHTQRTQNMIHWLKNYFEVFDVSGCQSGARLTDLISLLENDFTIRHFRRQKWINKPLKGPDPTSSDSVPSLRRINRSWTRLLLQHLLSLSVRAVELAAAELGRVARGIVLFFQLLQQQQQQLWWRQLADGMLVYCVNTRAGYSWSPSTNTKLQLAFCGNTGDWFRIKLSKAEEV